MPRPSSRLLLLLALFAVAAGCKPKIGEDCRISTDCSAAGDRLCDITAPGGYCTVYNCEPGSCPEDESLCVEFGAQRSTACDEDRQSPSPYARTFCMATCKKNSDCRDGYTCQDISKANKWGALLIDTNRGHKACLVPLALHAALSEEGGGDVCRAELPQMSSMSSGGSGGSGGASAGSAGTDGSAAGAAGSSEAGQGGAAQGGDGG